MPTAQLTGSLAGLVPLKEHKSENLQVLTQLHQFEYRAVNIVTMAAKRTGISRYRTMYTYTGNMN